MHYFKKKKLLKEAERHLTEARNMYYKFDHDGLLYPMIQGSDGFINKIKAEKKAAGKLLTMYLKLRQEERKHIKSKKFFHLLKWHRHGKL